MAGDCQSLLLQAEPTMQLSSPERQQETQLLDGDGRTWIISSDNECSGDTEILSDDDALDCIGLEHEKEVQYDVHTDGVYERVAKTCNSLRGVQNTPVGTQEYDTTSESRPCRYITDFDFLSEKLSEVSDLEKHSLRQWSTDGLTQQCKDEQGMDSSLQTPKSSIVPNAEKHSLRQWSTDGLTQQCNREQDMNSSLQTPKSSIVPNAFERHTPHVSESGSRPRSIASVRAASLRASGLRAAAQKAAKSCNFNMPDELADATMKVAYKKGKESTEVEIENRSRTMKASLSPTCTPKKLSTACAIYKHSPCMSTSKSRSKTNASDCAASSHGSGSYTAAQAAALIKSLPDQDSDTTIELTAQTVDGLLLHSKVLKKLKTGQNIAEHISTSYESLTPGLQESLSHTDSQRHGLSLPNEARERSDASLGKKCTLTGQVSHQHNSQKVRKLNFETKPSYAGVDAQQDTAAHKLQDRTSKISTQTGNSGSGEGSEMLKGATYVGEERSKNLDQLGPLSSGLATSANLSYLGSQEPGEDSQINALNVVDKLVWLNAACTSQDTELNVASQPSVKSAQCAHGTKGVQSLAHTAEMKTLQDKMNVYDWIDSQQDEADLSSDSKVVCGPSGSEKKLNSKFRKIKDQKKQNKSQSPVTSGLHRQRRNNVSIGAEKLMFSPWDERSPGLEVKPSEDVTEPHVMLAVSLKNRFRAELDNIQKDGGPPRIKSLVQRKHRKGDSIMGFSEHQASSNQFNLCKSNEASKKLQHYDHLTNNDHTDTLSEIGHDTQVAIEAINLIQQDTDQFCTGNEQKDKDRVGSGSNQIKNQQEASAKKAVLGKRKGVQFDTKQETTAVFQRDDTKKLKQGENLKEKHEYAKEEKSASGKIVKSSLQTGLKTQDQTKRLGDCENCRKQNVELTEEKHTSENLVRTGPQTRSKAREVISFTSHEVNYLSTTRNGKNSHIEQFRLDYTCERGMQKNLFSSANSSPGNMSGSMVRVRPMTRSLLAENQVKDEASEALMANVTSSHTSTTVLKGPRTGGRQRGRVMQECSLAVRKTQAETIHASSTFKKKSQDSLLNAAGIEPKNEGGYLGGSISRRTRSSLCLVKRNIVADQPRQVQTALPSDNVDKVKQPHGLVIQRLSSQQDSGGDKLERIANTNRENFSNTKETTAETSKNLDCSQTMHESRRKKREPGSVRVLLSHSLTEDTIKAQKKILTKLGGHLVTSAADCTHFVAHCFVRTRNMLETIAAGKAVVTPFWLDSCGQARYFVDEKNYILHDAKKEKELGFSMQSSLAAAQRKPLLRGMTVLLGPSLSPDAGAITSIIESAGGQVAAQGRFRLLQLDAMKNKDAFVVIASEKDYKFCFPFLKRGFKVHSTELIMNGIVVQHLDFSRNRLFEDFEQ